MDFLAGEPSGGAGTGCPGLKRETGGWLPQQSVPEDCPQQQGKRLLSTMTSKSSLLELRRPHPSALPFQRCHAANAGIIIRDTQLEHEWVLSVKSCHLDLFFQLWLLCNIICLVHSSEGICSMRSLEQDLIVWKETQHFQFLHFKL